MSDNAARTATEDWVNGGFAKKTIPSAAGNFAMLKADGGLEDSGRKSSDFAEANTTYTKAEVDAKVARAQTFRKLLVDALPSAASADDKAIYLVPRTGSETPDLCDEYVIVGEAGSRRWEKIGGGTAVDVTLDDAVTPASAKGVASSGIWSAIWGALAALPSGFASLYDWCVAQLAAKRGITDLVVYAAETRWSVEADGAEFATLLPMPGHAQTWHSADDNVVLRYLGGGRWFLSVVSPVASGTTVADEAADGFEVSASDGRTYALARFEAEGATSDTLARTSQLAQKQDALTEAQLAAANSGATAAKVETWDGYAAQIAAKASAADLRYALVVAPVGTMYSVPDAWFPITFTRDGSTYTVPLADRALIELTDDGSLVFTGAGAEATLAWFVNGVLAVLDGGVSSLQFNGVAPVLDETALDVTRTAMLSDRASNRVELEDATALTLTLPAAVPGYMRDLIVDVDNSAGASDVGLELASDATAYLDAGGARYLVAVADGDDLADLLTVAAGKRARLYFTETAQTATPTGGTSAVPVISLQRLTVTVGGAS